MRILVTGATGRLGQHVVDDLARRHEVVATTRNTDPASSCGVTWISADLSRLDAPWNLPPRIDAVLYLAQSRRYREFPEGAADMFAVNVGAFWRLAEYARLAGASHFGFTSTASVYGESTEPLDEAAPIAPTSFYATSKRMAEMILESYAAELPSTILRIFTVYGPSQTDGLVWNLIERVRAGRPVALGGEHGLVLSPVYFSDARRAIVRAIEEPAARGMASVFNVGGAEAVSIRELANAIARECGTVATFVRSEEGGAAGWPADSRAYSTATGWRSRVSLAEGLASTVAAQLLSS